MAARERRLPPVRGAGARSPWPAPRPRPGRPGRRSVAIGGLERRRRTKRLDDARPPLEPGRGDDRRARRPAAALGSRRAKPAGATSHACLSARSPAPSWSVSCAPVASRGRSSSGWAFDGRPPGWERALSELVREGVAVPAAVEGSARDGSRTPRCSSGRGGRARSLLSPFDDLVSDRDHTHALFDFFFRLEIYVPKGQASLGILRAADPPRRSADRPRRSAVRSVGRASCTWTRCMPRR